MLSSPRGIITPEHARRERGDMVTLRERKLAIVLLDLVGSTAFTQKVGARRAAEWLQYHDRLARSLLYRFRGREIDRSDGFMLSFENPLDAVNFALLYQRDIPQKTKLETRIGVHWGTVVEVEQDELMTMVGAKRYELEGIAKQIAARTMSLCSPRQVLLTEAAFNTVKGRTDTHTPRGTRYACVGLYRFKGVRAPVTLYAVGDTTPTLQPPRGNDKARRIGGPRRVKSRLRHMRALELGTWALTRAAAIAALALSGILLKWIANPDARRLWGLDHPPWTWIDHITSLVSLLTGN